MARPKGQPKLGGRKKGTPNKSTAQAKEAIARFVDGNSEKLDRWLDEIEQTDGPRAAFECFSKLVEYHVPKQSRNDADVNVRGDVKYTEKVSSQEVAARRRAVYKEYGLNLVKTD